MTKKNHEMLENFLFEPPRKILKMSFLATFIEKWVKDIADIQSDYGLTFLK